jgi:NosR/NirI family nitrous oxide reductase transcriptional regulator
LKVRPYGFIIIYYMDGDAARRRRLWLRRLAFIAAAAGALTASYFWGRYVEPPPKRLDAGRVALLVGATEPPEQLGGRTPYWRIVRGEETLYAGESAVFAPDVAGYGGAFDLFVVVDDEGNIERVVLIRHNETPSYLERVADFLTSFTGLAATAPLEPGRDVDVITRATVTSDAFAAAARTTARKLVAEALGRDVVLEGEGERWDWPWAVAVLAFFGAALWARRRPNEIIRIIFAFAAVGVLGFWAGRFVSVGDVGRFALLKFPPVGPRLSLYLLLGGGVVAAVIFGNVYCGWLCPFGAVSELLYKLPLKKLTVAPRFGRRLSGLRFIIFCVVVGAIVATRDLGAASYEPFDDLFAYAAAGVSLLFLIAVLAISIFHYRFFCRYLCAAGAFLGEVAAVGRRASAPGGEGARVPAGVCPTAAIAEAGSDFDATLCIECGRCRKARGDF